MLTHKRRDLIVEYINEKNAVTVQELMDEFDASAATIRRDLSVLNDEKKILKVFGGATSIGSLDVTTVEPSVSAKAKLNTKEKDAISKYAASLIIDDDFVYIDSGTTTLEMIKYIDNTKAKYITNGIVTHMAHVKISGWIWEHLQSIVFWFFRVHFSFVSIGLKPFFLPFFFNLLWHVFLHSEALHTFNSLLLHKFIFSSWTGPLPPE